MLKTKAPKRDRQAKYLQNDEVLHQEVANGLAKNILLLVEGQTEATYFNKLKQNSLLNGSLVGVVVEIVGNLGKAKEIARKRQNDYAQIWIVADNDKRNAFVLEQKGIPFFNKLSDKQLHESIINRLQTAYNADLHNYFLSIHEYLQWLNTVIGARNVIEFWDTIQYFTPLKNREFEEFDKEFIQRENDKIHLAYSCIAFEFWLILHFKRNAQPFLWVDKGKVEQLDVFTYFKTICPDYEKGDLKENKKEKCTAYSCLFLNWKKTHQTVQDEWDVLFRIITAYKHVKWLQNVMLPTLNRQSGKWYEVNPYVLGMDNLIAELLNIKSLRQPIDYFGLTFEFDFDKQKSQLNMKISVNDGDVFEITDSQKRCFEIKNRGETSFLPMIQEPIELPNHNQIVSLQYTIPEEERTGLVLIINDPRERSKSNQLFVLIN